ncbi:MAG: tetratricopeptide repeat protein [Chloroflexaceae bacterium]|nr:tetratricopeptide repeat protein [Chloroflexaceae bacterium]
MQTPPREQADALIVQGRALLEQGDLARATDLLNQAVRLYWAAGEQYAAAAQIGNYGWALRRKGRPDLARPYLEQAAALFEQLGLQDFAERHRFAAEDVNPGVTEELLASLPPAVRGALERGDGAGLQVALDALPFAERNLVLERLTAAGVIAPLDDDTDTREEALRQFEPLLQGIAAVARGDVGERAEVELALRDIERKGWRLRRAAERIWAGERSLDRLSEDLDDLDRALVERILAILDEGPAAPPHPSG